MTHLYLDDERSPTTQRNWKIVRSHDEAVAHVREHGVPGYISFDHDLGDGKTGYDFVKWLIEMDVEHIHHIPQSFKFNVHSANPVGANNIHQTLTHYLEYRNE